jgi:hypothetical protein
VIASSKESQAGALDHSSRAFGSAGQDKLAQRFLLISFRDAAFQATTLVSCNSTN